MTKQYIPIWAITLILLAAGIVVSASKKSAEPGNEWLPVQVRSLKMADGWGYEVLVDKKVYIHQDCIPAIASYKRFNSEADALLIGNKVVEKLKKGKKPGITKEDIEELRIKN